MAAATTSISSSATRIKPRTALIASADSSFRQRLGAVLSGLRWQVREAQGGAEAWGEALEALPQTIIVDSWLPDLDVNEFVHEFRSSFPKVDVIANGEASRQASASGPFRQEVLYALQHTQDSDTAAWNTALPLGDAGFPHNQRLSTSSALPDARKETQEEMVKEFAMPVPGKTLAIGAHERIPELIGNSVQMLEVSRRIRRVAPRTTPVLIEGPTGSGKELVAEAVHRLSTRGRNHFVAINCAAIPEALLEAELFGHTRGAFTGAVQSRVGRIEAADGGTLFLDEIGEMPLGLQSKLLRFVESGELQRIGDNDTVKVDVRIIAATHQPLGQKAQTGDFRADLYYRLAVFLIRTPALSSHLEDLPLLVEHFLERMGREMPMKRIDESAMTMLGAHNWPGNVRELEHVLERAEILAGDEPLLTAAEIDFGETVN